MRQGVKGCNGATFDADDVVYTFARAKSISGAAPIGWFLANVGSVDSFTPAVFAPDEAGAAARMLGDEVRKIDDYTVQIRQSGPNKLFLRVLTIFGLYIFDKEIMEANATEEDPWSHTYANNVNAPGFGPWCLDDWDKGAGFNVTAHADYYRGAPAYDRVVLRKVPQSANRVAILQSGRAQIAERLTPKEYNSLSKMDGVKVVGTYGNENLFLYVNYQVPPYDNLAMRKALAHAIPYDKVITTSYFGKARKWPGMIRPPIRDSTRPRCNTPMIRRRHAPSSPRPAIPAARAWRPSPMRSGSPTSPRRNRRSARRRPSCRRH